MSHLSVASLKSAFSLSAAQEPSSSPTSPPHSTSPGSLSPIPLDVSVFELSVSESSSQVVTSSLYLPLAASGGHIETDRPLSMNSYSSSPFIPSRPAAPTPDSSLPQLALSSPAVSFKFSFSPLISHDATPLNSPSFRGSPVQRPRAPTPGSIASYFPSSMDISDMNYNDYGNTLYRYNWYQTQDRLQVPSRLSCHLDSPGSSHLMNGSATYLRSPSLFDQALSTTPALLPPLMFEDTSLLSL